MGEIGISYPGYNIRHPYPACKNRDIYEKHTKFHFLFQPNRPKHMLLIFTEPMIEPTEYRMEDTRIYTLLTQIYIECVDLRKYNICTNYFAFISDVPAYLLGHVAQSVTCLATDVSLTADPVVPNSILAWSHTFVEIDHEIISTVILLPSAESYKKGCCQLQTKVCARSTG